MKEEPNARQVGGGHYRVHGTEYQHWDLVADTGMGYYEGMITKYVTRWREKDGLKDLQKAIHYCEKLQQLVNEERQPVRRITDDFGWEQFSKFALSHRLISLEQNVFELCVSRGTKNDLDRLHNLLEQVLAKANFQGSLGTRGGNDNAE